MIDEGDIENFLGIEITQLDKKKFKAPQPFLINCIISLIGFNPDGFDMKTNSKASPAAKGLMHKDIKGKPRKENWNYRSAVGMISYLQGNTRPDIFMAVNQTACLCIIP